MNCPSCGAPMRLQEDQDSLFCEYCNSAYLPEPNQEGIRDLGQTSDVGCPLCRQPLVHASLEHRRLLYCSGCRGTLLTMPVFADLVEILRSRHPAGVAASHPPEPHEFDRALHCPRCDRKMDTHFYAGGGSVVIDDCSPCELIWLDSGELSAIASAPDHSRRYELDEKPNF
ncbi:MAG TPA: zf-TFIIB domain-containing protein [Verrucomicrobiae bacterium]|nr:zf-TFIIB domain-containing protein [Verrucomicrobiae bacterium]